MLILLIILILVFGGGGGFYGYSRWVTVVVLALGWAPFSSFSSSRTC